MKPTLKPKGIPEEEPGKEVNITFKIVNALVSVISSNKRPSFFLECEFFSVAEVFRRWSPSLESVAKLQRPL